MLETFRDYALAVLINSFPSTQKTQSEILEHFKQLVGTLDVPSNLVNFGVELEDVRQELVKYFDQYAKNDGKVQLTQGLFKRIERVGGYVDKQKIPGKLLRTTGWTGVKALYGKKPKD